MPQRTYLVFGDIEGKLDVLRVECTKCARKGRYSGRRLIEEAAFATSWHVLAKRQKKAATVVP